MSLISSYVLLNTSFDDEQIFFTFSLTYICLQTNEHTRILSRPPVCHLTIITTEDPYS